MENNLLVKVIHGICYIMFWATWKRRNNLVHADQEARQSIIAEDVFSMVQRISLLWISNRYKNGPLDMDFLPETSF